MKKSVLGLTVIALAMGVGFGGVASAAAKPTPPKLTEAEFEKSKTIYFQRCAGCHGVLRKGATGKNLEPKNTIKKGTKRLTRIIQLGTEGGMNNFDDVMTKQEIDLMAK